MANILSHAERWRLLNERLHGAGTPLRMWAREWLRDDDNARRMAEEKDLGFEDVVWEEARQGQTCRELRRKAASEGVEYYYDGYTDLTHLPKETVVKLIFNHDANACWCGCCSTEQAFNNAVSLDSISAVINPHKVSTRGWKAFRALMNLWQLPKKDVEKVITGSRQDKELEADNSRVRQFVAIVQLGFTAFQAECRRLLALACVSDGVFKWRYCFSHRWSWMYSIHVVPQHVMLRFPRQPTSRQPPQPSWTCLETFACDAFVGICQFYDRCCADRFDAAFMKRVRVELATAKEARTVAWAHVRQVMQSRLSQKGVSSLTHTKKKKRRKKEEVANGSSADPTLEKRQRVRL